MKMSEKDLNLIKQLCQYKATTLFKVLKNTLAQYYDNVISKKDSYIIAEGKSPICLVAHLDTVFPQQPNEFFFDQKKNVLWSPWGAGFDDRAGVFAILKMILAGYRPHIILTLGEERGGLGAQELLQDYDSFPFGDIKCLIEIDRQGNNEVVYYLNDNKEFMEYIESFGFQREYGTFSDVYFLGAGWEINSCNISAGYADEHSESERLYFNFLYNTLDQLEEILININDMPQFEYREKAISQRGITRDYLKCEICDEFFTPDENTMYPICPNCLKEIEEGF